MSALEEVHAGGDAGVRDEAPVVVTGAHRSGTTLLGDIVSHAPRSWTVWEPFNRHWGLREVTQFYPYVTRSDPADRRVAALAHYLATGRARWSVKQGRRPAPLNTPHEVVRALGRFSEWRRGHRGRAVIKDPFLLLSLGAVQPLLTPRPVVVAVRHPCSWVVSLRRMSWPAGPELNALISQEELYERHLRHLLPRRDWTDADPVEAGARAWACLYHMVQVQVRDGARVLLVPLEAFGREPRATVDFLYTSLGLPRPADMDSLAGAYTGEGMAVTPEGTTKHLLQRNSRQLNDAWKQALQPGEVDLVRGIVEPVFAGVYDDWDTAAAPPRRTWDA